MEEKINIAVLEGNSFFRYGFKYFLEDYFRQRGKLTVFSDENNEGAPLDLVFSTAQLSRRSCYCHTTLLVHQNTRFFTIRDSRNSWLEALPKCALECGTLYHRDTQVSIHHLLDEALTQMPDRALNQGKTCAGSRLTRREKEVISYLCQSKSQTDAADKMRISVKTVNAHKQSVMRKLDLKKRQDFIYWLIKNRKHVSGLL
ncbi:response regulator transcription factor [Serratia sp. IR-2025]